MPPKKVTPRGESAPPVTASPTPKKRKPVQKKTVEAAKQTKVWIRNIRGIQCRMTLTNGRRINLEPRGQRGDCVALNEDDHQDSILLDNEGWLFQFVSAEDAAETISKQSTNSNQGPTLVDLLRDEYGNPMTSTGLQPSYESQGVVVAQTQQTGPQGRNQGQGEQINRPVGPQQVQVPGSVGHPTSIPNRPDGTQEANLHADVDGLRQSVNVEPPRQA